MEQSTPGRKRTEVVRKRRKGSNNRKLRRRKLLKIGIWLLILTAVAIFSYYAGKDVVSRYVHTGG